MRRAIAAALVVLALAPAAAADLTRTQSFFLGRAQQAAANAHRYWWDPRRGWYDDTIGNATAMPLARLWSAYPLFETLDAIAIAQPSSAHLAAVRAFATGAEQYWNPDVGGYAYYPRERGNKMTFFDDNGWWGLAFFDAYRATHDHRFVVDAARAFRFIYARGWDGHGVWWDTRHHKKTSEPLAAEILLGVELYRTTHVPGYRNTALELLRWADAHSWNAARGLYQRNATDGTVMDYVEGMMAAAHAELCAVTRQKSYCAKANQLGRASITAFGRTLDWAPQYDAIYLRWMLDVYAIDHDATWYDLAYDNAKRALAQAPDARGLYVLGWDHAGSPAHDAQPNMLELHAATASVLAWLAAMKPPPGTPATP